MHSDITAGLEFLHSHMIMHLDLKAENVLLEYEDDEGFGTPRAVLSDFGSSEARNRLQERERTGCTGTLDYVAPEALQINPATGKLRDLDASADLWSLGLLLVRSLWGGCLCSEACIQLIASPFCSTSFVSSSCLTPTKILTN